MKCKIFKEKTNRYQRRHYNTFIPKILNMYHDDYYYGFGHMKKAKKDKFNKRLKFHWSKWHQLRNTHFGHDFKNHFKKIEFTIQRSTYSKIMFCKQFCTKCYCFGTNWDIRCKYNNNKSIHQVYHDCIYLKTFENQFLRFITDINYSNSDIEKYLNINRMVHNNRDYNLELLKDIFLQREHISIKEK